MSALTMNQEFANTLQHMAFAADSDKPTGFSDTLMTRLIVSRDPVSGEMQATLYTEDGQGNGTGLFCVPIDMFKLFVVECDVQALEMHRIIIERE